MTPLKPLVTSAPVKAVAATRYETAGVCSHPECDRTDVSHHHIFGRFPGKDGDSWFVQIGPMDVERPSEKIPGLVEHGVTATIAHVVDLCGHGTAGHHGDIDSGMGGHQAWIKYEDGEFVWYERQLAEHAREPDETVWVRVGPLDPQPGAPAKPKPKPRKQTGPVRVASFKAPADDLEAAERIKDKVGDLLEKFEKAGHKVGRTVALERALDYTLLNAGPEDF